MKSLLKIVSLIGLLATIVPSFLVFTGVITVCSPVIRHFSTQCIKEL